MNYFRRIKGYLISLMIILIVLLVFLPTTINANVKVDCANAYENCMIKYTICSSIGEALCYCVSGYLFCVKYCE